MKKEILAVDFGGTHLRFAAIKNRKIIKFVKVERPESKKDTLKEIDRNVENLMSKNVRGIGVSFAGNVMNGIVELSPNLPFEGFNLGRYFRKFKKPVKIENDANCAALAEIKITGKKNFFIITIGTGIGGGIIIDGKLYKGGGFGGEFGGIILDNGKNFEHYAGTGAIKRLIKKYYGISANHEIVKRILHEKSKKAGKIRDEIADYIGQGIASLISIFDPEIVVLSGGMKKLGNSFLNMIKIKTRKYMHLKSMPEIRWSRIENPDILGAALLFD